MTIPSLPASEITMLEQRLARMEWLHPEMKIPEIHRVNLSLMMKSRFIWYGYELTPPPTNGQKASIEQEYREAMDAYTAWYAGHGLSQSLRQHEAENRRKSGMR